MGITRKKFIYFQGGLIKQSLSKEHADFIYKKRAEILIALTEYLQESAHTMTVEEVLTHVYAETEEDDFDDLIVRLGDTDTGEHMEEAQELAMKLFNYFPRKSKNGLSYAEEVTFIALKKTEKEFQRFINQ